MGNRAVITHDGEVGIYVHWNGGRASVEGFLTACREMEYRDFNCDPTYAFARLIEAVTVFFPDGLSVGVGPVSTLDCDNGDNGVYTVGGHFEITGRRSTPRRGDEINPEKTRDIADTICKRLRYIKRCGEREVKAFSAARKAKVAATA